MVGARKDGGWEGGRKRRVGGREGGRGGTGRDGGGREWGRGWREGERQGGRDDFMQGESVSGGREGWGREGWWRERARKGRNGAWTARGKEGREEASGGWIERGRKGVWEEGREGNFTGGSIFTNQPFTNRPLPLRLWCYKWQIVNMYKWLTLYCDASECIVWQIVNMVLCDGNYDWVHMACTRCIIGNPSEAG